MFSMRAGVVSNHGASWGRAAKERRDVALRFDGMAKWTECVGRFARWSSNLQRPGGTGRMSAVAGPFAVALVLIAAHMPPAAAAATPSSPMAAPRASVGTDTRVPPFEAPLARPPLEPPVVMNGGFGEYRSNHFHAGLDLGTGGRVGRPVFAPLGGWIERVRASGVGYGRSLYLRTTDGRTLVFGHLDAFAEPLASFVAAAQESTGQYEQDLWPERGRFHVTVGQRIAWTGESGSGGPHLHFEIRRGDMAYHPGRAGLALSDTITPTLASLTLEPLDDTSYVERGAAPYTLKLGTAPETLIVEGRVRAIVGSRDGMWKGVDRMVPWSTAIEFGGERVECRYDSVSWATDMVESDYVYDTGRVVGGEGMVMWAPAGFRPRVLVASAPLRDDAGTLVVRTGDPPRVLKITARDLGGGSAAREVVLRPPRRNEMGPDTSQVGGSADPDSSRWFDVAMLPGGFARVTFRGAPAGSKRVTVGRRAASWRQGGWSAVVVPVENPHQVWETTPIDVFSPVIRGRGPGGRAWQRSFPSLDIDVDMAMSFSPVIGSEIDWILKRDDYFELTSVLSTGELDARGAPPELVPRSRALELAPRTMPLRGPVRLAIRKPSPGRPRVGLYGDEGSGWSWIGTALDPTSGNMVGESRHLGRFALFEDTLAPRIASRRPARHPAAGPYPRWALEARLTEEGSGVDGRASRFEVGGRRVPSEWDAEERILRWRPRRVPGKGVHRYAIIAVDRAGNERRAAGRFVID